MRFYTIDLLGLLTMSVEPTRNPPAISEIVGPIDRRLTEVLNIERSKWVAVDASLAEPFDALEALIFSGGKEFAQLFSLGACWRWR